MPQFYITSENSEDRFDATENLQDAIRVAREVARHSHNGDSVCIEYQGKNIYQFILKPDGKVEEKKIA